jgi:hypothetical protein
LVTVAQDFDVRDPHEAAKHHVAVDLEPADLAKLLKGRIHGDKRDSEHQSALPNSIQEPSPKDCFVKENIINPDSVQFGIFQESLLVILLIENSEPHDRPERKNRIVQIIEHQVVHDGATELADETESDDRNHI